MFFFLAILKTVIRCRCKFNFLALSTFRPRYQLRDSTMRPIGGVPTASCRPCRIVVVFMIGRRGIIDRVHCSPATIRPGEYFFQPIGMRRDGRYLTPIVFHLGGL